MRARRRPRHGSGSARTRSTSRRDLGQPPPGCRRNPRGPVPDRPDTRCSRRRPSNSITSVWSFSLIRSPSTSAPAPPASIRRWGLSMATVALRRSGLGGRGLKVRDKPQLRPVLLCLEDRRLPLPRQVLEGVGVEQRLVKLATLAGAQFRQRRMSDHLLDAAAQLPGSPLAERRSNGILGGRCRRRTWRS
jgi:hypothetical protein